MSKNVTINGKNYTGVSKIKALLEGSSTEYAEFVDASEIETGGKEPILTTKEITENGTYVAANDGADGFSSVIVNVPVSEGNTGGDSDFGSSLQVVAPYLATAAGLFTSLRDGSGITSIPDLELLKCASVDKLFQNAADLTEVGVLNIPNCTNIGSFIAGSSITKIGLRNTGKVNSWYQSFRHTPLIEINGELDFSGATNVSGTFSNAVNLQKITFVANTIGLALDMSACKSLSHDSVISVLNGLKDTGAQLTLKLHADILNTLSDSEKAIATSKNWVLS